MDDSNYNRSRPRNWLYRLSHLKIRRFSERNTNNDEDVVLRRNIPSTTNSNERNNSNTRSSFRKSLMKMHNRLKNCISGRNSNLMNTPHITPQTSNRRRVTLHTPIKQAENIYSIEPLMHQDVSPIDIIQRRSLPAISVTEQPPELPFRTRTTGTPLRQSVQVIGSTQTSYRSEIPDLPPPCLQIEIESGRVPTDEILSLSNCYWYWGPISRQEAEEKLQNAPDGAFLIRDSSSTSYLFSISFRSVGKTLHSRIEYNRGKYSLYDQQGFDSITELIEHAVKISEVAVYCYSRNRENNPNFPVRLTKPISRYTRVRSLKYLCRFVIRQCTNINNIQNLPLPPLVKNYLQQEGYYF